MSVNNDDSAGAKLTPNLQEIMKYCRPEIKPSEYVRNANGGVKADGEKLHPTLLFKSMPYAIQQIISVLDIGAKKYSADNWKKVEAARYQDALLRHVLAYMSGEKYDQETNKEHLAHLMCCALFLIELEKEV